MSDLIKTFTERGDLAHLALLLWAGAASLALWVSLRELAAASRRFDDFVRELALFNRRAGRRRLRREIEHARGRGAFDDQPAQHDAAADDARS